MEKEENPLPINEKEVMDYYGCSNKFDIFRLNKIFTELDFTLSRIFIPTFKFCNKNAEI